jgi:hypothetical protein
MADPGSSLTEYRLKLQIPGKALAVGHSAVEELATGTARSFQDVLAAAELEPYLSKEEEEESQGGG